MFVLLSSFMMESFFVTIPSFGGGNTTGTFRQKLPEVIKVPGSWEVALAEFIYPASWINITEKNRRLYFCIERGKFTDKAWEMITEHELSCDQNNPHYYDLPLGYYTRERLGESLNRVINNYNIDFSCDDRKVDLYELPPSKTAKVFFAMKHGVMNFTAFERSLQMDVHADVADILGFKTREFSQQSMIAALTPNPRPFIIYLYTNIIEPQIVGSYKAQLLAVIPAAERNQLAIRYTNNPLQYFPLRYDQLESIEVHLRESNGDTIAFTSGHCVVKLHIRRKQ